MSPTHNPIHNMKELGNFLPFFFLVMPYVNVTDVSVLLNEHVFTYPCFFTQYNLRKVDPETGAVEGDEQGFADTYPLEDLELVPADFMAKVSLGDFRRAWEGMTETIGDGEVEEKFALAVKKMEEAVENTIALLGMQPCEGSEAVKSKTGPQNLYLSGKFVGNVAVLARCLFQVVENQMVLRICVRTNNRAVSQMIADCIR